MDRSKKLDKQKLYEIYRACRLCGAGAGYKMPIIQNLIKVDGEEIELRQKIRECLQLEVNSNDKMPPLICELCVDKLDDFYEFLSTCKQTNINTRKRLGLPLQDTPTTTKVIPAPVKATPAPAKVTPVAKKVVSKDIGTDTCMLGLIEATAVKEDIYPANKQLDVKKAKRNKVKKEEIKQESPIKTENSSTPKSLTLKDIKQLKDKDENDIKRTKDNKRKTRRNNSLDELIMTKVQKAPQNQHVTKPGPKSRKIETKDEPPPQPTRVKEKEDPPAKPTKKEDEQPKSSVKKDRDDECLNKLKRIRDKDVKTDLTPPPAKKTKSSEPPKPQPTKPQKCTKPPPKAVQTATTLSKTAQPDGVPCLACNAVLKTSVGFKNHMHYVHPVTWTPNHLACNACRDWFSTIEEAIAHHKKHTSYKCLRCKKKYKTGVLYHQHVENKRCLPDPDIPDVKCDYCSSTFPTNNLLKEHQCTGMDGKQGGKCSKCDRKFILMKNLTKHESTCTFGKQVAVEKQPSIDPDVKKRLLQMEVRITKCDDLLQYGPIVSACTVPHRFGLDRKSSYPYMPKLRVIKKPTFFNPMVPSPEENKEEFTIDDLNWGDFEAIDIKTVKKLSTLCLKVIFSSKMLGELEILDGIEVARRLALRKRINSIIFKADDASSTNSDSILDKDALAKTFEVVNDKLESEDKNYHSDSTVFDEKSVVGEEGSGSDAKIDDFDRYCVDNHDNSVNLGTDNSRIDNNVLISSVLSGTDVDINKTCDTNIVNVEEPSVGSVSEDILENCILEVKNPTDTIIENDISLKENTTFDNINSSNGSPSVMNTENSTNDNDYTIMTKNHDILSKNHNEESLNSVIEANDSLTNHDKLSINNSGDKNQSESMEIDTDTNNLDENLVNNENTTENSQNENPNEYSHDDGQNTEVENMDIDETCSKNSLNLDNTNKISENSDTESIGKVSNNKIDIDNNKSEDSCTKNSEIIKITSSEINTNHDNLQNINENINETQTTSPQKANKSLDFSVTGILNHVTSKNLDTDPKNIATNNEKGPKINTESIENAAIDTKEPQSNTNNDKINNDNQSLDNISLNDDNFSVKSDYDSKNDKHNDSVSQNSIFTNTLKTQNDYTSSVNSLKYTEHSNVNNSDRFDVNDLSEDERKLMAELDEQIGETNDKIDKLNDGRDMNLESFNDGYNFD